MTNIVFGPGVIETYSGTAYDFENPSSASITLEDVAHALSNACRYAGHTKRFYSVAEHSVLVSRILEAWGRSKDWQRRGLMHDGHEAYVWDAPRPIKPLLGADFKRLADIADTAICKALLPGVETSALHAPIIKKADDTALVYESLELMVHGADRWESRPDVPPLPKNLDLKNTDPWCIGNQYERGQLGKIPSQAKAAFLARAQELGIEEVR